MHDPVLGPAEVVYERSAIERWLKHHDTCPCTLEPIVHWDTKQNLRPATERRTVREPQTFSLPVSDSKFPVQCRP